MPERSPSIYASSLTRRDKRWRARRRRVFSVGSVSRAGACLAGLCVTAAAIAERVLL